MYAQKFNILLMFSCVCAKIISKNNITIERRKKSMTKVARAFSWDHLVSSLLQVALIAHVHMHTMYFILYSWCARVEYRDAMKYINIVIIIMTTIIVVKCVFDRFGPTNEQCMCHSMRMQNLAKLWPATK